MESRDVWPLFEKYNKKYFGGKLYKVKVSWSPRMTLCAGKTAFKVWKRGGTSCSIRLSQPLLSQRPHSDTVNTLLHEMIHAYLHVTQGLNYRDSHGPEFRQHMNRINNLEGSKITIYHNFRKEVDKYRVNVYRCDGPCVSRRPFFGILRRAIERPPGPEDRWWARHQSECGGTFHKIEGPGAKPTQGTSVAKRPNYEKSTSSQNAFQCNKSNSPANAVISSQVNCKKKLNNERKTIHQGDTNQKGDFNEDAILKRIRDKYSNVKQTIMLSKEASEQLSKVNNSGEDYRQPTSSGRSSSYRHPAPFGNYVEGKIDYDYQGHSPRQIKLKMYLDRYREVRKSLGLSVNKSKKSSQLLHDNRKQTDSILDSSKLNSVDISDNDENERSSNYEDYHPTSSGRSSSYRHPAPFGNYVEGNINYNYQVHSPRQIKLRKYLDRYQEARKSLGLSIRKSKKSLQYPKNNRKQINSPLGADKLKSSNVCEDNENERSLDYEYHSKTPRKIRLEKYMNKYQAASCTGSHDVGSSQVTFKPDKFLKAGSTKVCCDEPVLTQGSLKTTLCPICSTQIPVTDYERHIGECFGDDLDFETDFGAESNAPKKGTSEDMGSFWEDMSSVTNCSNCGSKVLVEEMKIHLQFCVQSDSDDSDLEESSRPLTPKGLRNERKLIINSSKNDNIVSCPSCMERVQEKNIQKHLDVCLSFVCEEF